MALTVLNVAFPFAPVHPRTAGGAEHVLMMLDRDLTRSGHTSLVLAARGSRVSGTLLEAPSVQGILDSVDKTPIYDFYKNALATILLHRHIDVMHFHGIDFHRCLPHPSIPVLATLHLPVHWYPPAIFTPGSGMHMNCVSKTQFQQVPAYCRCCVGYIPNGIPVSGTFTRRIPREKRQFVLCLGRICPEKGFHHAIAAARMSDMFLIIAGAVFPYRAHIDFFTRHIAPHIDGKRVSFLGAVGPVKKRTLLRHARCILIPSLVAETSSLVAMEALAAGTPVVAFGNGALPEIVSHGVTGFIVRSAVEMADAIHRCDSLDPADCFHAARTRFSCDRMCRDYKNLYTAILDGAV